jgi:hypothetical protein
MPEIFASPNRINDTNGKNGLNLRKILPQIIRGIYGAKMASKKTSKKSATKRQNVQPAWLRILLALSMAPLILGVVLIGAWSLDITLIGELENQIWVGLMLILFSFTLFNLLQKKWGLFAGWLLLTIADFLLLALVDLRVQILALVLAALGMGFLIIEFYKQYQRQSQQNK